ncbi:MAG: stage II sporulation protein M, partial [Anaerolineales bacterium]
TSRLELLKTIPVISFSLVWLQNLRAIFLATLAGIFTFGVLGVIILALPFALIGYLMASMARIGISPWVFLSAFILPHALFEVPAILLSGGAILRLGAILVTPTSGRSIGEAWLRVLADWAKLALGLVLPLMFIAAGVEMFLTPRIALWLLNR